MTCTFVLMGFDVVHSVLVATDVTQDCLLGIDFIGKQNCKIDFEAKTISIEEKVVELRGKTGSYEVLSYVQRKLWLCLVDRKCYFMQCEDHELGMVEFVKQHDLLLARVVAEPRKNAVLIRRVNPSPPPVTLYKNTSIDTFSQLHKSALEPAQCSYLASQPTRKKEKPKVSDQFDLDTVDMTGEQTARLVTLLDEYSHVCSSGPDDLGRMGVAKHQIDTSNHPPIKHLPR